MRHDRDTYLKVNLTYVAANAQNNFIKETRTINHVPYEYGSDMHYTSDAFATKGHSLVPTVILGATQWRYQRTMGSRTISFYDIRLLNKQYQCNACAGIGVTGKCKNAGVPNPKNCNACICPSGYGGVLCNQRKAGCGGPLAASTAWKSRSITLGNATITTIRDTYTTCNDWITAPAGKTIQIRVTALKDVVCTNGCVYSSIEPKILTDKAMTSPRTCCPEQLNKILATKVIPTPVVTYSVYLRSTFTYQYRYV
ncbi:astacin [Ostertagia ostertagi]